MNDGAICAAQCRLTPVGPSRKGRFPMKTIVACTMSMIFGMAVAGGVALGQSKKDKTVVNQSAKKHPKLHAAQKHVEKAVEKIGAAQTANEFDLGGHAEKAKKLLSDANDELKKAALESNENKKK